MEATTSKYIIVNESGIHNKGVFAATDIPEGTFILPYVGEKITKEESEIRGEQVLEASKNHVTKGAVYIFEFDDDCDIDGNVDWNTARYINHSCSPNCDAVMTTEDGLWIQASRDIKKGEELSYNYGYSLDDFEEHPCRCGAPNCVGYIVDEDQWDRLKRILARRERKRAGIKV